MDLEQIKTLLPHRPPMLLVQQVDLDEEGNANGQYTVSGDEFFLQGHFPGKPVVPGVILCEMLAQTCCILLGSNASEKDVTPFFTSLDKVKFRRPVTPGDTLHTKCRIVRSKSVFYFAEGTGHVNGELAVSANFSFALVKAEQP